MYGVLTELILAGSAVSDSYSAVIFAGDCRSELVNSTIKPFNSYVLQVLYNFNIIIC